MQTIKSKFGLAVLLVLSGTLFWSAPVTAELSIDSVYPTLGSLGESLPVIIQGNEFDGNTRVTMALDSGNRRSVIGGIDTPAYAHQVVVLGDLAYVADGESGLKVIDITHPENLQIIAALDTPGTAYGVAIYDTVAYIADGDNGLQVVDVSTPTQPQKIGSGLDTPGEARFVTVVGNRAYIADGPGGLQVVDISNPLHPQIIGSKDIGFEANCVQVKGGIAYISGSGPNVSGGALKLIDIATPSNLSIIGSVEIPGYFAFGVTLVDDIAYVAAWKYYGVQVVDVSNPSHPEIIGWFNTNGRAYSIAVEGDIAYVADDIGGISVLDISDPENLQRIGTIDTQSEARSVVIKNDVAYVADGEAGLQLVDIKTPKIQQVLSWVPTPGLSQYFEIKGSHVYLGDAEGGLQVIDIRDLKAPRIIGHVDTLHKARDVDVVGNIAYVADTQGGLQVVDINDATNPSIVGSYIPSEPWTRHVTVDEVHDIAFLSNGLRAILVDVSIPSDPVLIKEVPGFDWADGITAIKGTFAYVPDKSANAIRVIDFSTPSFASIVKTIAVPGEGGSGPRCVTIVGDRAYVANGDYGLCILDISNPANPAFNASWTLSLFDRAYFVSVVGDVAYVADGNSGIQLVDVSNPANMKIIGSLDTTGGANCVSVIDDKALVGDFGNGFIVVPLPVEIKPLAVNSATRISCTLPSPSLPGHYILRVFNDRGDIFDLDGAVSFSDTVKNSKAIVITGGNYCGDQGHLEDDFQMVANAAYNALLYQGFQKDDIMFLGPDLSVDADGDGLMDDMDALNSYQNIALAMTTWSVNEAPHDMIVYMVGHGASGYYSPNCNDKIMADELKSWVNDIQSTVSGNVIFIYDACQAGAFLLNMDESIAPNRIVITSCKSNEESKFLLGGFISYSFGFWSSVSTRRGARLDKAFNNGKDLMKPHQTPWVDANGDLQPNTSEDVISDIVIFGRGYQPDKEMPKIGAVSGNISLYGETRADFWATGITTAAGSLAAVFAYVTPPCFNPDPSVPVTSLEKIVLTETDDEGVFEGNYSNFNQAGTYKITIYAKDAQGYISEPKEMYVYQSVGPDAYEKDDSYTRATYIMLNDTASQCHNFFDPEDEDWVTFYGVSGETYTIEASNLGPNNDVVIEVYDTDGISKLMEKNYVGNPRADEVLDWLCPADGTYYVKFRPAGSDISGEGTDYRLKVFRSIAALLGRIGGTVTDADTGDPIIGATMQTNQGASAGSIENGVYLIIHRAGTDFSLSADAEGYLKKTIEGIVVNEDATTTIRIVLNAGDDDPDNPGNGSNGGGGGGCFVQTVLDRGW